MFKALAAIALLCLATPVAAQTVERAPVPAWVAPLSAPASEPPVDDAPIRLLAMDEQVRIDAEGSHDYTFRRIRIQTRQGLGYVSTVSGVWNPPRERLEVHAIRILRGDQVIDALDGQEFQTLRRENNLESSMLDGRLTATLQPRDLRVGDILETAFTIHDNGGVLAPHRESLTSASSGLVVDRYRLRISWPAGLALRAQATRPWEAVRARRVGADWVFEIDQSNLAPERLPDDLPARYSLSRVTQVTDFADWAAASRLMAPLFARSETLEADSPLKAEIARIAAAGEDPAVRAAAALRLVQDQVRYVALSMGEGGYVPTPADEVWRSRFGDCKGKTVLLLALLHGLGIEAEAAMVSSSHGDGLDDKLPLMAWFDHVLARATIGGKVYWLDGTGVGDRGLETVGAPPYRWALPVRAEGAGLVPIVQPPVTTPNVAITIEADASAGIDTEAPLTMDMAYYGAAAVAMRQQVGTIPADQLQTMMTSNFDGEDQSVTIESVDTRYDEAANVFHLILHGKGRMSWVEGAGGGRAMALMDTELAVPTAEERKGLFAAYKDAPYAIAHPSMSVAAIRLVLPNHGEGFRLEGGDQTVEAGGYRIERRARLENGVAEATVTSVSLAPEITAAQMKEARDRADGLASAGLRVRAPANYTATAADRARMEPGASDMDDLIKRAERLSDAGDRTGALALLDAAVEREPQNAKALRARGAVRLGNRDYAGARADYDAAVDVDPADVDAAVGQGAVARAEGRWNDAIVSYSVALRLDPSNLNALSARGASYNQIGRYDRSLADYRALKTTAPQVSVGLLGELRALRRLNRADEARTLIADRLKTEPTDSVALDALVTLSKDAGRPAEALPALDAAVAAAPEEVGLRTLLAEARVAAGDAAGARADYQAARDQAGGDPLMLNNVCWSQATAGFDLERALADCDQAAQAGEAGVIDSRAMALLQLERYAEAKAGYDQALAAAPNLAPSLFGRGLARLAMGDAAGQEDVVRARALSVDVADDFAAFLARHPELKP